MMDNKENFNKTLEKKETMSKYLIWLDMEMSGLNPETDSILEVAVVVTDNELKIIDQLESIAINQPDSVLSNMDSWNTAAHTKSGLVERVKRSQISVDDAQELVLNFVKKYVKKNTTPLCGNTVYQDRKFIIKYMPKLEDFLHYRLIDVSTIKELAKRWYSNMPVFEKHNKHEALADIIESIEELKHYRKFLMHPNFPDCE
jgi:oligoribonuclease